MLLSRIKLINALLVIIWWLSYDVLAILWCACDHKPCGWHCICFGYVIKYLIEGLKAVLDSKGVIQSLLDDNLVSWRACLNQSCCKLYELAVV